jgi:hypothetical protein
MESSIASLRHPDPDAVEFVRFCYRRRRVGWPELYDEMCAVASRGLYRGLGPDDLAGLGIGFSLFDMPALAGLAATVVAEEQSRRRPVAVAIVAEPVAIPIATADEAPTEAESIATDVEVHASEPERTTEPRIERAGIDVPIRLAVAPGGA